MANKLTTLWKALWAERVEPSAVVPENPLELLNPTTPDGWEWDFSDACCPDCGSRYFRTGPRGGLAVTIKCICCGSKFMYDPPFTPKRSTVDDSHFNMQHKPQLLEDIG